MSHERLDIAGAEGFHSSEGNMCGTAMRGADALPGSKATSRAKGSRWNLGGPRTYGSGRGRAMKRTSLPLLCPQVVKADYRVPLHLLVNRSNSA